MANIRYTLLGMTSLIIAWINIINYGNAIIGVICAFLYLYSTARLFGSFFIPDSTKTQKLIIGLLACVSLLMLGGSVIYYFGSVSALSLSVLLTVILLIASITHKKSNNEYEQKTKRIDISIAIIFLISILAWWLSIYDVQITQSVRSIWLVIDPKILLSIFIAVLALIIATTKSASKITTLMFSLLFVSVLTLAFSAFALGYGFDPFIHRATIEHIAQFGTITPKPLYYIGQYALELIGILIFSLPIKLLDGLLVPILASILIPASALFCIKSLGHNWRMMLIALLLLPFGVFISTTPQSLAYILTTCIVLLALPVFMDKVSSKAYLLFLFLLTVATISVHPIAGIPAFIFFTLVIINRLNIANKYKTVLVPTTVLIGAIALPAIFAIQSIISNLKIKISLAGLSLQQLNLTAFLSNQYNAWLDLMYLVVDNHLWIVIILSIIGVYFTKKENLPNGIYNFVYAGIASIISYLILTTAMQFEFLIEYERSNYADRLITLAIIFLIPIVGIALSSIWTRIENKAISLKLVFVVILAIIGTSMVYGAFPRHDNYARSSGFNVSQADIDAVYAIDNYALGKEYIVLANQAVSSASIEAFGFKKYYNNEIFYYPIPTGGELYNYYLEMTNNEPSAQIMDQALDLTGAQVGFLVINDYWWESERLIEFAKTQCADWFALGDGAVNVFVFEK